MGLKNFLSKLRINEVSVVDCGAGEGVQIVLAKRADDYEAFLKGKYTAEQRKEMAGKEAMENGSYPVKDADDLERAIRAVGRGKNNSHEAIRRHVMARAKVLGLSDKIPDTWTKEGETEKRLAIVKVAGQPFLAEDADAVAKTTISPAVAALLRKLEIAAPCGEDEDQGAHDFEYELEEQQLGQAFWDAWYQATGALQAALRSILNDETVNDKSAAITQSLQQFADHIEATMPASVGKALAGGNSAVQVTGDSMTPAVKKALGLPETASEADVLAKLATLNKMSDKHEAFMNHDKAKLPKGGKEAFQAMSAAERDEHIKSNPIEPEDEDVEKLLKRGEAFKAADGNVFTKKDFGSEAAYRLAKSQSDIIAKQADEIAKAKEEKTASEFEKRATDLGFGKDFGPVMRKAYQGDAAAQAEIEKRIKGLNKQVSEGALFSEIGKSVAETGSAEAELWAKADELRKSKPELTREQAFAKVYADPANRQTVALSKREHRAN